MSGIAITERARTSIELGESHFREFKSALEGQPDNKKKRDIKEISTNIAQTLVAFANADGGELLIGVEDSGEITGLIGFNESELELLESAAKNRIHTDTPLPSVKKQRIELDGKTVLYFSVPKSTRYVHLTSDGRCLQRRDLESVPVPAESIQFDRREQKSREYDREFIDGVSAEDLDLELVRVVADQVKKGMSAEKCLQYLELAEYGLSQLRLKRSALLLFSKTPSKWHPRLQIRILKVDGDSIQTGEEYNVVSDELIAGNILTLVEQAWDALRPHLVHTRFDKSARFEQRSIYPEHACREALLNAIAHRDYSDEGRGIEVYIFNNHLEVKNPGALLSTIQLTDIAAQTGVHQSRNTHLSRVLRELGYMRELGEGMRRIYELMQRNELAPPQINSSTDEFKITLTHKPLYSAKDLLWLNQFEKYGLDREQKAVILLGDNERVFSTQQVWDAVGIVDTEHYRKLVDSLLRLQILSSHIDRDKAKRDARRKRIPFREFPRYKISIPSPHVAKNENDINIKSEDLPDEKKRIFIKNLPMDFQKDSLFETLSKFGNITYLNLPKYGKNYKGYGYVEFESMESSLALLEGKIQFEGRILKTSIARPRQTK